MSFITVTVLDLNGNSYPVQLLCGPCENIRTVLHDELSKYKNLSWLSLFDYRYASPCVHYYVENSKGDADDLDKLAEQSNPSCDSDSNVSDRVSSFENNIDLLQKLSGEVFVIQNQFENEEEIENGDITPAKAQDSESNSSQSSGNVKKVSPVHSHNSDSGNQIPQDQTNGADINDFKLVLDSNSIITMTINAKIQIQMLANDMIYRECKMAGRFGDSEKNRFLEYVSEQIRWALNLHLESELYFRNYRTRTHWPEYELAKRFIMLYFDDPWQEYRANITHFCAMEAATYVATLHSHQYTKRYIKHPLKGFPTFRKRYDRASILTEWVNILEEKLETDTPWLQLKLQYIIDFIIFDLKPFSPGQRFLANRGADFFSPGEVANINGNNDGGLGSGVFELSSFGTAIQKLAKLVLDCLSKGLLPISLFKDRLWNQSIIMFYILDNELSDTACKSRLLNLFRQLWSSKEKLETDGDICFDHVCRRDIVQRVLGVLAGKTALESTQSKSDMINKIMDSALSMQIKMKDGERTGPRIFQSFQREPFENPVCWVVNKAVRQERIEVLNQVSIAPICSIRSVTKNKNSRFAGKWKKKNNRNDNINTGGRECRRNKDSKKRRREKRKMFFKEKKKKKETKSGDVNSLGTDEADGGGIGIGDEKDVG